jgi:hexosaminidase
MEGYGEMKGSSRWILTALILFFSVPVLSQNLTLPLIPVPSFIQEHPGSFIISDSTVIVASDSCIPARMLKEHLKETHALDLAIVGKDPGRANSILFHDYISPDHQIDREAYQMTIAAKGVSVSAYKDAGKFYALQTLLQLLPANKGAKVELPCLMIIDKPRYSWRGMHLDCCRHFFTVEEVKKYIDYLAMYKFNVFHWHLTDDQGWRIEIKKYPLLTRIGSQRKQTLIGKPSKNNKYDKKPYGGYYTQDQVREVVAYAAAKNITIVPEIEMPGHSLAALAAYPELSCTGGPFQVGERWGGYDDVFCAGNDSTFIFIENVLDEVLMMFPSQYIHIGGDECSKVRWNSCSKCQARIRNQNLKDEEELQSYFIRRVEKYINSKGRKIIGWDEILEGGLAPNATVMSWRGVKGGISAAKLGHDVIMTPGKPCYFDFYQSKDRASEPIAIGGFNPVDSVYKYDPAPEVLSEDERKHVLGAQGNVWTEYIDTFKKVEYMTVPRMCALSEVLWSPAEKRDVANFRSRLRKHALILDRMKINYAKHFLR